MIHSEFLFVFTTRLHTLYNYVAGSSFIVIIYRNHTLIFFTS